MNKIDFHENITFGSRNKPRKFVKDNGCCLGAFFVTAGIMLITYILYEVFPFGDKMILWSDCLEQYAPFYTELFDRITQGKSLIYSWNTGLGMPFLGNFFNYLSSPASILIFIFGRNYIPEAIATMILLKASCASYSFAYYLKKSQGKRDFVTLGFGVLYSMSGWFIAYYWNIMWLDALIFFPLVILGIERLIKDKKPIAYIVSLGLTLLTNYYMGYMTCIFSCLYFLVYYFSNYSIKEIIDNSKIKSLLISRGFLFAGSSLAAACVAAVSLIPTFINLQNSSATAGSWPTEVKFNFTFFNFIYNHLIDVAPTFKTKFDIVTPNVCCGVLIVLLVVLFYFVQGVKLKEKVIYSTLLVFLYFSMNLNYLNYIWHGFHFPNDLPYRFSFMYSFVLLVIAHKTFLYIKNVKIQFWIISFFIISILFILVKKYATAYVGNTIEISILVITAYLFLLILLKFSHKEQIIMFFLMVGIIFETLFSTSGYYQMYHNRKDFISDNEVAENLNNCISNGNAEDTFYREENLISSRINSGSVFNYNGINSFTSMGYQQIAFIQSRLGAYSNQKNYYHFEFQTPVYNMMHCIKYLAVNNRIAQNKSDYYNFICENEEYSILENQYYLPLMFPVAQEIINWKTELSNPFELQNDWVKLSTGIDGIFNKLKMNDFSFQNAKEVKYDEKEDEFIVYPFDEKGKITVTASFRSDGNHCYGFGELTSKKIFDSIQDFNDCSLGETINLTADFENESDEILKIKLYAYSIEDAVLNNVYNILESNSPKVFVEDTKINSYINVNKDSVVYTSIPYDKGWTVKIDDQKIPEEDYIKLADAYLCFNIGEGEHKVEMSFRQRGLLPGIIISSASVILTAAYLIIKRKRFAANNIAE